MEKVQLALQKLEIHYWECGVYGRIKRKPNLILATGTSGTIGRHLSNFVKPIDKKLEEIGKGDFDNIDTDFVLLHLAGLVGTNVVLKI